MNCFVRLHTSIQQKMNHALKQTLTKLFPVGLRGRKLPTVFNTEEPLSASWMQNNATPSGRNDCAPIGIGFDTAAAVGFGPSFAGFVYNVLQSNK